ncbi:MAG: hypothetical protein D6E12_06930 [Desulfovibrio sp.]|nr:MAG: hypothetical protein D6E12_06930 [Desulfovibrio sp.]
MGKLLQIRVMAQTFRPEDQEKAWPVLLSLAWPEFLRDGILKGTDKGVLETVQALDNQRRFGDWHDDLKKLLQADIDKAVSLKDSLEKALGDWNATTANKLSDELEDLLKAMEASIPKELRPEKD